MTRMTAGTVHNTGRTAFRVGGSLVLPGKSAHVDDLEAEELPARGVFVKPDAEPPAEAPVETAAQARKREAAEAKAAQATAPDAGAAGDDKPDTVEETQP